MSTKRSFLLHVINYSWVLFLVGIALLGLFHAIGLESKIKENASLAIELNENTGPEVQKVFVDWLNQQKEIIQGSLHFISQEELKDFLPDELSSDSARQEAIALLPKILVFKLNPSAFEQGEFNRFKKLINDRTEVKEFSYQNELTEDIEKAFGRIRSGFMFVSLIFIMIGAAISEYLARVFVDSRSELIKKWNHLGASESMIARPYLIRIYYLALASSFLSVALMGLIILFIYYLFPWAYQWIDTIKFIWVMLILLILGPILQYELVRRKIKILLN